MSRFSNFSALGAAEPAGQDDQGHLANGQARQPMQRNDQPQQWPRCARTDRFQGQRAAGRPRNLDAASHVETLHTQPVLGFLFNQRGGLGTAALPPCDWEVSQD